MAIDSRIALNLQPLNIGQRFAQNIQNLQQTDLLNTRRDFAPIQLQQAQQQAELQLAQQPALLQQAERAVSGEAQLSAQQQQAQQIATSYATALRPLLNNPQALITELQRQKVQFQQAGVDTSGIDDDILQAQTAEGLKLLAQEINSALAPARSQVESAGTREFNNLVRVAQDSDATQLERDSANRALGNLAKVSTSAAERIAGDEGLTSLVASSTAQIEGARESARETSKLKAQKKFKPLIASAVKLAEKEAAEKGEVLTDLARMEAALPGLKDAIGQLSDLAKISTSTIGGRAFDFLVKESGFGSTQGATARAKFIAIINNQVLPLLKPTFGAAFTVQEGAELKATMGDPNATPEEKAAQLLAFIDQKERDIVTKQKQLDQGSASKVLNFDSQGNLI